MPRPKILIVDDSPVDAELLRRHLTLDGNVTEYHITVAPTGSEGLAVASAFSPDVVLLDFDLPDMDGLEFLRALPAHMKPGADAPVVLAVTGQSDPRVAAELIRAGAEDYIGKNHATAESVRLAVRQAARSKSLRAALAERARERQRSREELLASLERASFVASFSEALSKSLSVEAVFTAVGELAVPRLADACFVDLYTEGTLLRRHTRAHDALVQLESQPLRAASSVDAYEGAAKVLRSGVPAAYARSWLTTLARWDAGVAAAMKLAPVESAIVVPLVFDGAPLGAITLLALRRLDGYAQDVAGELGRRASSALANARAFEAERAAKRASEEARRRLSVLSRVSELFTHSLEWRETLQQVTSAIVPAVADYAALAVEEDGELATVAEAPRGGIAPSFAQRRRDLTLQAEFHPGAAGGSFMRVPIVAPTGAACGDLVLCTNSYRSLSIDDVGLAEDIGRRIGMYIATARAFEREREIARGLQQSLLPSTIPAVPGVQFAARCVAGASGVDVGGDWYDIIPLREGHVAFAVGDVAGRGVLAAATMGQLRSSLRSYILEGLAPGDALARLNAFILSQEHMQFATVAVGVLHCATGVVRFASAGHLPPAIIDPEQGARTLEVDSALPVGIISDQRFTEERIVLEKGQSLALFTDGLVESHSKDIGNGTEQLIGRLSKAAQFDDVLHHALADMPDEPVDDVTFLAVRYLGIGAETIDGDVPRVLLTLPAVPQSAALVRQQLEQFCERTGVSSERCFDLQLAVGEAVANAIEHAYGGAQNAIFSVHARAENGEVIVDVLDQGRWREGVRTPPGQLSERGRGVGLMRSLCDRVRIDRSLVGTRIQLGLALEESSPATATG